MRARLKLVLCVLATAAGFIVTGLMTRPGTEPLAAMAPEPPAVMPLRLSPLQARMLSNDAAEAKAAATLRHEVVETFKKQVKPCWRLNAKADGSLVFGASVEVESGSAWIRASELTDPETTMRRFGPELVECMQYQARQVRKRRLSLSSPALQHPAVASYAGRETVTVTAPGPCTAGEERHGT
jgi:hypothetical protein